DTDYTLAGTRLDAVVVAFPAVRRRGNPRIAVIAADAAFAVPGVGRHVGGAAQRYAQPRDDRRARRTQLAGRADGGAAAGVRPVPRADWLPLRQPPFCPRLAARALYLDGDAAAVRRARDHAVRSAGSVGRRTGAGYRGPDRRSTRFPAGRGWTAHDADCRT